MEACLSLLPASTSTAVTTKEPKDHDTPIQLDRIGPRFRNLHSTQDYTYACSPVTSPLAELSNSNSALSQQSQVTSIAQKNELTNLGLADLPALPKLPSESLPLILKQHPTFTSFLSQFQAPVIFIGKGPHPVTKNPQHSNANVLIKQVPILTSTDRFLDEIRCLERIKFAATEEERNITPEFLGYWVDTEKNIAFIALKCVSGRTFSEVARAVAAADGPEGVTTWQNLWSSAHRQLQLLHALNIVHGDIHEFNFMVDESGTKTWIIDFGRAYITPLEVEKITDLENFEDLWDLPDQIKERLTVK